MTQIVIGVGVSKDRIDVFDGSGRGERLAMETRALRRFAKAAAKRNAFVVFEATGGYGAPLRDALEKAEARYHRANP